MTTSNVLYRLLAIGMFGVFSGTLAYQSWRQARREAETVSAPVERGEPDNTVPA